MQKFEKLIALMDEEIGKAPQIVRPSNFWQRLNKKHGEALAKAGVENFRLTLARDYFTWSRVLPWDSQIRFLLRHLPVTTIAKCAALTIAHPKHDSIPLSESLAMNFLTRLVWSYAVLAQPRLSQLKEPEFGNPPRIIENGRLISQDLANSILEFSSYEDETKGTVCELGGGYGRNAYVAGKLGKFDRYILADISPALGVAQVFIENEFPESKIFGFRRFDSYEQIAQEFESSQFAFLLPHQLEMIPASSVDLFLNISSLHEMEQAQVDYYLGQIRRLVKAGGHFYLKAWQQSNNPDAAEMINASDYDFTGFDEVFWRTPPIQTRFFETLQIRSA